MHTFDDMSSITRGVGAPTLRAFRLGSRGKCWHTASIVVAQSRGGEWVVIEDCAYLYTIARAA
jgi:hypothetical protein